MTDYGASSNNSGMNDIYHRIGNTCPATDSIVHEYNMWLASAKLVGHCLPPVPVGMIELRREDGSLPLQDNYELCTDEDHR